ncbi:hypothetical protein PIB30_035203 [Stylosanthes scabra]|uniref:Ubiquitin-like protease family profile domain-containing protein n=1 Tax=Stylosanthes scabra TaxID=79078 RepID=A0ABU6RDG9_9FABA|nr:hypothetical protein [Stylosanthes scabra]
MKILLAKIRARKKKEGRKRQEGKDKEQTEESESLGSESDEDSEEEEYQTTDSEPEPEPEVQRERRSKKKEDDSVIHQRQKIEREERSKRRREDKAKNETEPTLAIQFDHLAKKKVQSKEAPSKKKKTSDTNPVQPQKYIPAQAEADDTNLVQPHMDIPVQATILPEHELDIPVQASTISEPEAEPEQDIQIGPQPQPEPIMYIGPQPQPESNIEGGLEPVVYFGPEPAELLDGYMAECERDEKIFERKREEADAEIKACDEAEAQYKTKRTTGEEIGESEIDLAIRRAVEGVLAEEQEMEKQEREAAPTLNKIGQHAPGLMMVVSVTTEAVEYDPSKAFDLDFTQPQPQAESAELYELDDFPEEPENLITPGVPPRWHLEVPRSQFRTMRPEKEIDSVVITAYSLVLNDEPIPRFQNDVYILPPRPLSKVMNHFKNNYIDIGIKKVHSIDPFESDEHLSMVNNNKLITHRYIFVPVLFSEHWWMYVLDKVKKSFFVIDSRPKEDPGPERTKINKFAEKLQEFRNEIISGIILSKSNKLIKGAIHGAMETTIHKPSAALQSPYVQVTMEELKKLG